MLPNKTLNQTSGLLMAAWKDCRPYDPNSTSISDSVFTSNNYFRVSLGCNGQTAISKAVEKCSKYTDQYPHTTLDDTFRRFVADARELAAADTVTHDFLRRKLSDFAGQFDKQEEWEVVLAVTGLDYGQPSFTLGCCRFYVMDQMEFHRWGQRESTGRYDPPPNAPILPIQPLDSQIVGNWAAGIRVRAVDSQHANRKARLRLEEVLNVLRYGVFLFGRPHNYPRTGLGRTTFWNNHWLCMRITTPGSFTRSSDGAEGANVKTCSYSPGWEAILSVISKEGPARKRLEATVVTALEWVGQAAAAPLPSIRIVSLVTALEVLLMGEHESLGKRSKVSKRLPRIAASVRPDWTGVEAKTDKLYHLRSECLHDGVTDVEEGEINTAFEFVAAIIQAYLTAEPYMNCSDLQAVLGILEPEDEFSYVI